ncbi:uncharacterized protein LOC122861139 [Aphidius gifuensis]|uniref:uncharacterized protein LOC122861139 n=1 Tax=Aphidius gifuensis TaxID=684658 RepID=UPI001CDCC7FD|nr:uncharacterized protein LOC122861139 [Aphidius gifuensis]
MHQIVSTLSVSLSIILALVGNTEAESWYSDPFINIDRNLKNFETTKKTLLDDIYSRKTSELCQLKDQMFDETEHDDDLIVQEWQKAYTQMTNCYQEHLAFLCRTIDAANEKREVAQTAIREFSIGASPYVNEYQRFVNDLIYKVNENQRFQSLMENCVDLAYNDFSQSQIKPFVSVCIYRRWHLC